MNNLKSFYLVGHSFGGYIAGSYTCKYPQHVKKLILVSPIGIRVPPKDESWEERIEKRSRQGGGPPKWVKPTVKYFWYNRISPFSFGKVLG